VDSIDKVREDGKIQEEQVIFFFYQMCCMCFMDLAIRWFGLILLPIVSFSGDGAVAIVYFVRYVVCYLRGRTLPITTLATGRAIDLSVQFTLFWMPLLVLLGWWTGKPMTLLFGASA
jgi:Ca2+:H+ antiporter